MAERLKDNMSQRERNALKELSRDRNIVDIKGATTVLINRKVVSKSRVIFCQSNPEIIGLPTGTVLVCESL